MISVGSSDARKELGLGVSGAGGGSVGMEDSELEEGEACSYQNNEEYDPDVALSYIDEKIQDVLGHFQKDFEGGVSAENLGAKFGGYGSFLPTYQRSPGWSHPRTPPKVHGQNMPRSPNNFHVEGGQGDVAYCSSATQSLRLGPNSVNSSRPPAAKASSIDGGINEEKFMTSNSAEAFTSKYESMNTKSSSISDQKTLKVRIKMGTDNLSTRKNAAIYSGLGLDMSPSSSLDDSPSESEGISHDPQYASFESPISILQIMTSLPMMLSPLPDNLIQLTGEETCAKDRPIPVHMDDPESSGMPQFNSNNIKGDRKKLGGKKMKYVDGYGSSIEAQGGTHKNVRNDIGTMSRKEPVINALTTEELVSKTLKLPLLSSSYSSSDDSLKDVDGPCDTLKEANKGTVMEKAFSDQAQKERVEPTSTEGKGFVTKVKGGSGRKVAGDKVGKCLDDLSVYTVKDNLEGDEIPDSIIAESNVDKGRADLNIEHAEPPKKASSQTGNLFEQDNMTLPVVKEHQFPIGKKKPKGSHWTMVTESEKETLNAGTSLVSKAKKSSDDSAASKNETENARVQKDHGRARDAYRDFFGEMEEEDRMDSQETPYEDKLKDPEVVKRSTSTTTFAVKERSGGKKVDKPLTSDAYPKTAPNLVRCAGNVHAIENGNGNGVPVTVPPIVIEENWVQCDRCQKWRLLPLGTNPDSLPEKWLCSMLNWLPEMNRCSVSEDETTKALIALFQGPPTEGQGISGSFLVGGTSSTAQHPNQYHLNHSLHSMPDGKKRIVKEISNSASKDGPSQLSSSIKKNFQSSIKSKSLSDVNKSPVHSEPDVLGEKHKSKQKILENYSDSGDTKNLKVKSLRDPDQDYTGPSKKVKTDSNHFTDEEWITDPSGATRKVGHSLNRSFPTTSAGKERPKQKDSSSLRDSKHDGKDRLQVSGGKTKDKGRVSLDEGSLDMRNHDTVDSVKKRKLKEYRDSGCDHLQESKISLQEEFSDSRKEKKARLTKSEGRESSTSKGTGRTDKKVSHSKNQKLRQEPGSSLSQHSLDGMDCMKRDLRSVQASAAATSSSSKVSGSHKTKASFQEVKGSPVESVSSSPLRILNTDKFTSGELVAKDDSHDTGALGSPRRCVDGEDDGGSDRFGTTRKDKIVGQDRTYFSGEQVKDQFQGEGRNDVHCVNNMSNPRKTGHGSSSRSKDNSLSCKSKSTAEKVKKTSFLSQMQDRSPPSEAKHMDSKDKLQEKFGFKSDKSENMIADKKEYTGKESKQNDTQLNRGHDYEEVSLDAMCKQEASSASGQNQLLDRDDERYSKRSLSDRTDQEVLGKGKSLPFPSSAAAQIETSCRGSQPVDCFHKGNGDMAVDHSKNDNASKILKKQIRKADHQTGTQLISSKHPVLNGHRSKELDAPSPIRRDSSSHAANNAFKEAKDLKHLADRLKNSGSTLESTGLYFQAALKFLHGASLLESGNNDNSKHNEMNQSKQMYSSTAKLCEFCAHEYEKLKDMAAAALAYKCMEVAYMRVIYYSHTSANRDRHELQTALQTVPLGESPSSSASDVDNANNSTTADKVALSKGVSSPQFAGTHVIAAHYRRNFVQLLDFAQDVNFAMEASRKSRIAFAAANSSSGEGKHAEGISSIKKALDFNFHDVEGLLRLVRLAMEAINR